MSGLFKFIFESLTDPLSLPIPALWEYLIISVIGFFAYVLAFRAIGKLYDEDIISTSTIGSFLHWTLRLIIFIAMVAITYVIIQTVRFLISNWLLVLGMLFAILIVTAGIKGYKTTEITIKGL